MFPCSARHLGYKQPLPSPPDLPGLIFMSRFSCSFEQKPNVGWIGVKINVLMNPWAPWSNGRSTAPRHHGGSEGWGRRSTVLDLRIQMREGAELLDSHVPSSSFGRISTAQHTHIHTHGRL